MGATLPHGKLCRGIEDRIGVGAVMSYFRGCLRAELLLGTHWG